MIEKICNNLLMMAEDIIPKCQTEEELKVVKAEFDKLFNLIFKEVFK